MISFEKYLEKYGFDKTIYYYQSNWLNEESSKLTATNFSEESEQDNTTEREPKQSGKDIYPMDLQVGDYIRLENDSEYMLTEYINHKNSNINKMKDPNIIEFRAYNMQTDEIENIKLKDTDTIKLLKSKENVFRVIYTEPKIKNAQRIMKETELIVIAKSKTQVEKYMDTFGDKIKIVSIERLLHARTNKTDKKTIKEKQKI